MISVSEALSIIANISCKLSPRITDLHQAEALILSNDIPSPIHMPPFRQSAMDGYALSMAEGLNTYQVIGEIKAGDSQNYQLSPGQAVRIFTGAWVPDTADTVVMQEHVTTTEDQITLEKAISKNQNIRAVGEQIRKGDIALKRGTKLTPAAIGFLAGLGINKVEVYTPPKVGIIITGNELIKPGIELNPGKIYESNSFQLEAILHQLKVADIKKYYVKDTYENVKNSIHEAIQNNDLVLISGGISVGDYDFVKEALLELHTHELFYKVKQKPGKPLFFGKNGDTLIFALPGNPASSLTCFYIYVLPIIHKIMGNPSIGLPKISKTCTSDFAKKGDRAQFLKAQVIDATVEILEGQSSAMLHTFALANALIYIPEDQNLVKQGEKVQAILLPS